MEEGSYMLIEPGMPVSGTDGSLGTVSEIIADLGTDVFRGIVVTYGILGSHQAFVAPEFVTRVTEADGVECRLTRDELSRLPPRLASRA